MLGTDELLKLIAGNETVEEAATSHVVIGGQREGAVRRRLEHMLDPLWRHRVGKADHCSLHDGFGIEPAVEGLVGEHPLDAKHRHTAETDVHIVK